MNYLSKTCNMKLSRKILLVFIILFIAIQFFRPSKNAGAASGPQDIHSVINVPDTVNSILRTACYDCHSDSTRYPWYAKLQPVAWWLNNHIREGKAELNFTEFAGYTLKKQQNKLKGIVHEITEGDMPLSSYTLIHRDAVLSKEQKEIITVWAKTAADSLAGKGK